MTTTDTAPRASTPEPPPLDAPGDVWAELIDAETIPGLRQAMAERRQFGIDKYGKPLARQNGRSHQTDYLQEVLDGLVYARAGGDSYGEQVQRRELVRLLGGPMPRPVEQPDEGTCQTSEMDLLRAENDRLRAEKNATGLIDPLIAEIESALGPRETWPDGEDIPGVICWLKDDNRQLREALSETAAALGNGSSVSPDCSVEFLREVPGEVKAVVSGLHAELATANDRAATLEREIDRLRLQPGQPVATFDGKEWRTTVGSIEFMLASMEGEKSANVYWGVNTMLKITGASRGEVNQHVSDLLAFRGIRVQE